MKTETYELSCGYHSSSTFILCLSPVIGGRSVCLDSILPTVEPLSNGPFTLHSLPSFLPSFSASELRALRAFTKIQASNRQDTREVYHVLILCGLMKQQADTHN